MLQDGTEVLYDSRCVNPRNFGLCFYRLDGTVYVCGTAAHQFPTIPDPFGPGGPGGGFPTLPPGTGSGAGLHIFGVDVGDVTRFLAGLGGNQDLSGLVQVAAALVSIGAGVRSDLGNLPGEFGGTFSPGFGVLGAALDALVPGLGGRLSSALEAHAKSATDDATAGAAGTWGSFPAVADDVFKALVAAVGGTLSQLGDLYKQGVDGLLRAMLDVFRTSIEGFGEVRPDNVDQVAAAALRDALTAGTTAQLAGMGLELLHPLKQMGVQQAIGVLAEFAGFSEIAKPFFGATLRHAIGQPAQHRAALHFRTTLPDIRLVRELAAIGLVPLEKYHERLELEGFPVPYPAAMADHVYTPPSPRMVAQLLDGSESDRPWLARVFRRNGFSPEDADRATRAAEVKTTAPGRSRLVAALMADYKAGRIGAAELQAGLAGAGLSVTHQTYYVRAAQLERRADRMENVATEAQNQYRADVISRAALAQMLTSLGYADDEVTVRLAVGDLKRNQVLVAAEEAALETEIRAVKAKGLANATRQLRAGFLSRGEFVAVGVGMGYSPALLESAADLAELQGPVKTTATEAAIGTGALDEARTRIADLITQQVQLKRADRVAALVSLQVLGLPTDLATVLVDLAGALAGPTPYPGDFGFATGTLVGGPVGAVVETVLGGLANVPRGADLLNLALGALHLPIRDREALVAIIRGLRSLFGK